jgi:hypothetical protein
MTPMQTHFWTSVQCLPLTAKRSPARPLTNSRPPVAPYRHVLPTSDAPSLANEDLGGGTMAISPPFMPCRCASAEHVHQRSQIVTWGGGAGAGVGGWGRHLPPFKFKRKTPACDSSRSHSEPSPCPHSHWPLLSASPPDPVGSWDHCA